MKSDRTGPAFPGQYVKHPSGEIGNNIAIMEQGEGITRREYYAAHAPDVPSWYWLEPGEGMPDMMKRLIGWRWHYADMMISEGSKS